MSRIKTKKKGGKGEGKREKGRSFQGVKKRHMDSQGGEGKQCQKTKKGGETELRSSGKTVSRGYGKILSGRDRGKKGMGGKRGRERGKSLKAGGKLNKKDAVRTKRGRMKGKGMT